MGQMALEEKKSEKNYLTPRGYQTLVDELEQLQKVERPEITRLVAWAASNGDRSENADYIYGKKRLREIDKRLRFLLGRLDQALVVDPKTIESLKVQFGATVTVLNEAGEEKIYSIVGVDEVQAQKGWISWKSPIGRSLIGKEVGDSALAQTPQGEVELEIVAIMYKEIL